MSETRGSYIQYGRIDTQIAKAADDGILEEFRVEFLACWERLPNKAFFLILLLAWLGLFQFLGNSTLGYVPSRSLIVWLYQAYNPSIPETAHTEDEPAPDLGDPHGLIVPFVVLGMFWWKRKELMGIQFRTWWPGLLLVIAGCFFHWLGFAVQQPRISVVGLFTGIYGLTGLAWGPEWLRRSFFPYCLFVFSMPLGSLAEPITFKLRLLVSRLVEVICNNVFMIDIKRVGTALIDPTGKYQYEVAAACSGIRSLIITLGIAIVLGFVSFRSWWKRIVMFASAFPMAVFGNIVRMLVIVLVSEFLGREWGKWIHNGGPAGIFSLLPYIPAFWGLLVIERRLGREPAPFAAQTTQKPSRDSDLPSIQSTEPALAEGKQL